MFLQSRYLTVVPGEDECIPRHSECPLPLSFLSPSRGFPSLSPSCSLGTPSPGWRWCWSRWWHLGNSCLPPTFLTLSSPRAHYSDYQHCQSERPAPLDPAVPPFWGPRGCADGRIRRSPRRRRGTEGDGGGKRMIFNTSTGERSSEGEGEYI